jgi:predicted membrane channel-forming protein YqfA (hemolysin III family)
MHTDHDLRAEFYNAITHGLGAFLSVIGSIVLITRRRSTAIAGN